MNLGKVARKFKKAIGYSDSMNTSEEDSKLLETIRKCVELDADATDEQRALELDDLRFCDPSTQWSDEDRASREDNGRPVLTEDRLNPFLAQVCNEQRKNKPGVQVNPVDDFGDVETAEVIQGLIRHIEYASNADTAYDTAFESAARVGRGVYRILTEYVDDEGFNQNVVIKRISNHHNAYTDPAAEEADRSDAKWGGLKTWLSQADFNEQYPDSKTSSIGTDAWKAIGDDAPDWMSKEGTACMVVEHFYKEFTKVKVGQGNQTREAIKTTVKWVKCTAVEVLERGEFASKYIPFVWVLGKEVMINGKRTYSGLIRSGKDPQKRHNYLLTSQVERIAFMPIATWLGAKGFMGKEKRAWRNAHKDPMAALEFEVIGDDGQGINAPRMITEEAPIRAVTEAMLGAEQGMKAVLGMYDANMGNRDGNQSGLAIGRLQAQGETGNFHLQDNLSRALRYEGRILLDLIPTVYDTERVLRIIGEDGAQQTVRVNAPQQEVEDTLDDKRRDVSKIYDLTSGKYDVTVSSGPSYQSKRQEDRALLMSMLTGPMGQLIASTAGDLVASTLDSPISKKLQNRFHMALPPQFQDKKEEDQIPPQIKQQMDEMGQQHEQLTQALQAAHDQIEMNKHDHETEMQKAQLDSQTKIAIAEMSNQVELIKLQATVDAKTADQAIIAKVQELESAHVELEQLTLAMHDGLSAPGETREMHKQEQSGTAPSNVHEPTAAKPDPMHVLMQGHTAALQSIAEAMKRGNGAKKIVMDANGKPIGVAPADEEM